MADEQEAARWVAVGERLGEARRARRLTKRAAASRAGFSEITWRNLEQGARQAAPGVLIPVSPRDETLEAAARAVDIDPAELFELAQRPYTELPAASTRTSEIEVDFNSKVARLPPEDQEYVLGLVERLLRERS